MSVAPAVESARDNSRPKSPYVGLAPYDEHDAAFFFGRTQEAAIISANLRSARLTIVYGPSGVGKSSLLMAGVVHGLREQARFGADESPFAVCAIRSWLDDPVRSLQEASHAALEGLVGDEALPEPGATLADSLRAWTERAGTLLVVLDQFEEYFQYHSDEGDGERLTGFAAELARIVNDPTLAVNVLLSIREDAWARLDRFEGHIPLLFANYLRVDHLDLDAAREAIEGPINAWNSTLPRGAEPYDIEPTLTGAVLTAAAAGLTLGAGGDAARAEAALGDRIEAPFLQLVLERLWRETLADGGHVLTLARLEALGGARRIVENHLLEALGRLTLLEQDVASDCFRFLVSSSKSKIAHPAADLAEWTRRLETEVTAVLDKLCSGESGRILRAVAPTPDDARSSSYELFHDVLAEPILVWRRGHEQERRRRAAQRRLARVGAVLLSLVAVFAALSIWALIERRHANHAFHAQRALLHTEQAASRKLRARVVALKRKQEQTAADTATQNATVNQLTETNNSLKSQNDQLQKSSDALSQQVNSTSAQNQQLAAGIARYNKQNRTLAAKINSLDTQYDQANSELADLTEAYASLRGEAGILKAEARTLRAQRTVLLRQQSGLRRKAAELGFRLPALTEAQVAPVLVTPPRVQKRARVFGIPAALPGSDRLRRRIEALERQLKQLLERRARLTNEAAWLRKDNALLMQKRNALRKEIAQLRAKRAALTAQNRKLRQTSRAARAEHERLSSQTAARTVRNRKTERALEARRNANAATQAGNNGSVDAMGYTRAAISELRRENRALVDFIAPPVNKLVRAAQDGSQEPPLAGLLAVKAYRLTPYDPDDPAHPGVYNALWLALSRLDDNAARSLIAPVATPSGKLGTTRSSTLAKKICGLVIRGLTQAEWSRFLPASAPYTAESSRPCA